MAEIPNTDSPQAILDGDLFAVFRAGNAQPFAQRAHDVRTPRDDSVSPDKLQTHSVTEPKIAPRAVDHNKIGSGNAPDGQVLTADGSGDASWTNPTASGVDSESATDGQVLTADGSGNASWADAGGGGGGGARGKGDLGLPTTAASNSIRFSPDLSRSGPRWPSTGLTAVMRHLPGSVPRHWWNVGSNCYNYNALVGTTAGTAADQQGSLIFVNVADPNTG